MKRTTYALAGVGLVLIGILVGQALHQVGPSDAVPEDFQKLGSAYDIIRQSYVEPVSADTLSRTSIEGMLGALDTYSVYISRDRMVRVQEAFEGSFEGIGITYELIPHREGQDTIAVVRVLPGGPSDEAQLRAGDRIIRVNGESAIGWSHEKIRRQLKGPKGSRVDVSLRRPGLDTLLQRTITRGTVPLETVEAAYMLDPHTGYVRLGRFAQPTSRELSAALDTLKNRGMERLVFDLRGNAGGLMSMAEEVADEFLTDGQLIVTARSRHPEYEGRRLATAEGQFETGAMVVLVDEHSASASEIVAGALQDHDRAVIVGQPTFGKGLVQRQFELDDGSGLRLTVARFYTPSGRLLQRTEREDTDSLTARMAAASPDGESVPDSLVHHTDAGRRVIGGGGIRPDRIVEPGEKAAFFAAVESRGVIEDFTRQWMDARMDSLYQKWKGRPNAFADDFVLPSTVYPAFVRYAAERGLRVPVARKKEPVPKGSGSRESGPSFSQEQVASARADVNTVIKSYVGQRLFGPSMAIRIQNRRDPVLSAALDSWTRAAKWARQYPVQ